MGTGCLLPDSGCSGSCPPVLLWLPLPKVLFDNRFLGEHCCLLLPHRGWGRDQQWKNCSSLAGKVYNISYSITSGFCFHSLSQIIREIRNTSVFHVLHLCWYFLDISKTLSSFTGFFSRGLFFLSIFSTLNMKWNGLQWLIKPEKFVCWEVGVEKLLALISPDDMK